MEAPERDSDLYGDEPKTAGSFADRSDYVRLRDRLERSAAEKAQLRGFCTPSAGGSFTRPISERLVRGDGTTIRALSKAKQGSRRTNKDGRRVQKRFDASARLHISGDSKPSWGNKFSILMVRGNEGQINDEIILSAEFCENEMETSVRMAKRCARHFHQLQADKPDEEAHGPLGWIYDGACAGTYMQELMAAGWLTLTKSRQHANARAGEWPEPVYVETQTVTLADGTRTSVQLWARNRELGLVEDDLNGERHFLPAEMISVKPYGLARSRWCWRAEYRLPAPFEGVKVRVRLDATDEDQKRGFNRAQNLSAWPSHLAEQLGKERAKTDYFFRLYGQRAHIESLNRRIKRWLYEQRAHSYGAARQQFEFLFTVHSLNALTMYLANLREEGKSPPPVEPDPGLDDKLLAA